MTDYGFLAIWCEIAAEDLDDYRNWLTQEHIADRTFSPGFLGVRLFEALNDTRSHFILYATDGPDVLNGPAYKAILDNPSPWTRRIMPRFGPFDRALGRQVLKIGNGFGSHVAIWRIKVTGSGPDPETLARDLALSCGRDGVVSIRLYRVSRDTTDRHSEEKTMRKGSEGDFDFLLCAEAMGEQAAVQIEERLGADLGRLFPSLAGFDSSCRRMIYGEAPHEGPTG
ncbi:hypothetical protein CSC94_23575 [Zhengella mangrovi]|uniref:Uncharacterized protein n=1 Tax=Zhengella mangrovi TaxID=1982044 RepID=A0A2G1QGD8_9HYPH|nr:hypothetical protein [Zhengella mangrovi]PHP64593.1 hypothetical protein CSC94_23575 [Zhengella mangrovi]